MNTTLRTAVLVAVSAGSIACGSARAPRLWSDEFQPELTIASGGRLWMIRGNDIRVVDTSLWETARVASGSPTSSRELVGAYPTDSEIALVYADKQLHLSQAMLDGTSQMIEIDEGGLPLARDEHGSPRDALLGMRADGDTRLALLGTHGDVILDEYQGVRRTRRRTIGYRTLCPDRLPTAAWGEAQRNGNSLSLAHGTCDPLAAWSGPTGKWTIVLADDFMPDADHSESTLRVVDESGAQIAEQPLDVVAASYTIDFSIAGRVAPTLSISRMRLDEHGRLLPIDIGSGRRTNHWVLRDGLIVAESCSQSLSADPVEMTCLVGGRRIRWAHRDTLRSVQLLSAGGSGPVQILEVPADESKDSSTYFPIAWLSSADNLIVVWSDGRHITLDQALHPV